MTVKKNQKYLGVSLRHVVFLFTALALQNSASQPLSACTGKSFFSTRPLYRSYRPELWSGFLNDRMEECDTLIGGALDIVSFVAQSTHGNELATYFLPNCAQNLTVKEHPQENDNTDLAAQNFNIITTEGAPLFSETGFESIVSLFAQQSTIGCGLQYKQGFLFRNEKTDWWYINISSSLQHIINNVKIHENVIDNGGGADTKQLPQAVSSLTEAFAQAAWNYGKIISNRNMKKTGFADIELKIARQWIWNNLYHCATYIGLLIPTGNKPKGQYLFEAIVGNNHHAGIMAGMEGGFKLWSNNQQSWQLNFECAAQAEYLFPNTQTRSFDLKNKPWSRYLSLYANQAQAEQAQQLIRINPLEAAYLSTPGINIFTQYVNVSPGFLFNATGALTIAHDKDFKFELGYNFYTREAECLTLTNRWQQGPAIKDISGNGQTNPIRNITGNTLLETITPIPLSSYQDHVIKRTDLDLNCGAHPKIIINLMYGAFTYNSCCAKDPIHVNIGSCYEWGNAIAVMKRWVVWGKTGISF